MAATPVDVKEYLNSYVFVIDKSGLKSDNIKVQIEEDNILIISDESKRADRDAKYVRMERRIDKFMRKFVLPEDANINKISEVCKDGVLTVTVDKVPPSDPKKSNTSEIKIA